MNLFFRTKFVKKIKPLKAIIFLKIKANSATTGPPIGPILGQYGIPTVPFCKQFNDRTQHLDSSALLEVSLFLNINSEYKFNISAPTFSFFLKRGLSLTKGVSKVGYFDLFEKTNWPVGFSGNLILSQFLLYEIVLYKRGITISSTNALQSVLRSLKGSVSSMGLHLKLF